MKKRFNMTLITCLITVLVFAGLFSGCSSDLEDGYIMEGVFVAGVDVGGMTREDAISKVQLATSNTYTELTMVVHVGGYTIELSPELTGITLDCEAAVNAAYKLGRSGTPAQMEKDQLQAMTTGIHVDISNALSLSEKNLYSILETMCQDFGGSTFTQSSYEIIGQMPDLTAEEITDEPQVLVITLGTPALTLDMDSLCTQVMDSYCKNEFEVTYLCSSTEPDEIDLEAIHAEYFSEPVNAVMDPETFEVSAHAYGYGFDLDAAKELLAQASYGDTVEIPFVVIAPDDTKEELSSLLFRDVLGQGSAYCESGGYRATNLRLACEALDGLVLMPGETLSYNLALGERTPDKGWKPAGTYVGGETVDTYGGGICQPSSVLYYCCLLADLEIVHRANHQYESSYMDPGMDATVYWGDVDFLFANNTDYPIRLEAHADGGNVEIAIWGTDTRDYYVEMEYEILNWWSWVEEIVEIPEDDNPRGYGDGDVISSPYSGCLVHTFKCRYDKETGELIERVFEAESIYSSRNLKIVKIIPSETEETEPSEPETEPTEPETEPTEPETEPTEPETEPTVPETEPTVLETEATDPPVTDDSSTNG